MRQQMAHMACGKESPLMGLRGVSVERVERMVLINRTWLLWAMIWANVLEDCSLKNQNQIYLARDSDVELFDFELEPEDVLNPVH